jgi:glycosyltransferase involved in cell wall biosynthesis
MDRSRIALIIPALNEAASIGPVVASSLAFGVPIVVDDGSKDGTAEIAAAAGAEVVSHAENMGYDAALNSGFRRAHELKFEWAITLDADGQHDPSTLRAFMIELENGADVVVGVRDRRQRLAEHIFAWCGRRLWNIRDPLCGMKGYRMTVFGAHGCFDSSGSVGTELAIMAAVRRYNIREVPVPTRARVGAPRFGSSLRANARILRALFVVGAKACSVRRAMREGGVGGIPLG